MNELTTQTTRNPAEVYLASLASKNSQRSQKQALAVIAEILGTNPAETPWQALRSEHTNLIRAELIRRYKPATVIRILSALRKTLKNAWRLGLMTAEEYSRAVDLDRVEGETVPAGRELSQGEILALMNDCATSKTIDVRDSAIIAVMYSCGLRRAEVVKLDLEDFDPATGRMLIHGKKAKERTVYVLDGAADALAAWLELRTVYSVPGPLFFAVSKGGAMGTDRMSTQAIYRILASRAKGANVKSFSPHDMRRTFISDMLDAGADISTISKLAGHSNPQTTARYDRRPEEAKRKAQKLLHVPYKVRKDENN